MERDKIKETNHNHDDKDDEEETNKIGLKMDAGLARGDDKRKIETEARWEGARSKGKMRNCRSTE